MNELTGDINTLKTTLYSLSEELPLKCGCGRFSIDVKPYTKGIIAGFKASKKCDFCGAPPINMYIKKTDTDGKRLFNQIKRLKDK